jgi:hypothetical protein
MMMSSVQQGMRTRRNNSRSGGEEEIRGRTVAAVGVSGSLEN